MTEQEHVWWYSRSRQSLRQKTEDRARVVASFGQDGIGHGREEPAVLRGQPRRPPGEHPDESVDLVYLDPPFNSNRTYNVLFKEKSGEESPAQIEAFDDTWAWNRMPSTHTTS